MVASKLKRLYPNRLELCELRRSLDKLAAVNIVDKETEGEVGGQTGVHESYTREFPAGEIQDETNTGPEFDQFKRPRQAEIGEELTQLTTEREKGKVQQKDTQHGRWDESYSDENSFEDADLKLGENQNDDDVDPLEQPTYEPYAQGTGPLNPRYEDAGEKYDIVLHSSRVAEEEIDPNKGPKQIWIAVDLDGTILDTPPGDVYEEDGKNLFGAPKPGVREAMYEMIDGGARVSVYTARMYFAKTKEQEDSLLFDIENILVENDIPFTDVYVGKKPPAHMYIDDRNIVFDDDWDAVLDTVRDKLEKKANDPVKDTVNFQGIDIDVEWPSGSIRSYEGADTYVTHMKADYGYARGVEGNDGEELDIYLVDRESTSPVAFIIEQLTEEGEYDEDKIVLGVESAGEAADTYLKHMPSYMLGDIREVPVERLRNALYGEPEDRRGQEDQTPSEEKKAMILKVAGYSEIAIEAIEKANITPLAKLILQHVDPNVEYVTMVDQLVRAMLRDQKLKEQVEQLLGRRPELGYPDYNPEEVEETLGDETIKAISYKVATKTWFPEDDIFENEYTDGTEDRENRDIPRPEEKEKSTYRNALKEKDCCD